MKWFNWVYQNLEFELPRTLYVENRYAISTHEHFSL